MKSLYFACILFVAFMAITHATDFGNSVFESKTSRMKIFLCPVENIDSSVDQNQLSYIVQYGGIPRYGIPKRDGHLIFSELSELRIIAYADNLDLKFFNFSKRNIEIRKIDLSILDEVIEKKMPKEMDGPILHQWFSSIQSISKDTLNIKYVFAKHPLTFQVQIEVKFINHEVGGAKVRVIDVIPKEWGEMTPPDHIAE